MSVAVSAAKCVLDLRGREQLLQLGERAAGDDAALVQDRDAVGQMFGLVEVLRGQQHGRARVREFLDHAPHFDAGFGVEARGRLVEVDDLGVSDQAHRDVEAATHAAGVGADLAGAGIRQAEGRQQVVGDLPGVWQVPQLRDQHEVLSSGEAQVDDRRAQDDGEQTPVSQSSAQPPVKVTCALQTREIAGDDAHGRYSGIHSSQRQCPMKKVEYRVIEVGIFRLQCTGMTGERLRHRRSDSTFRAEGSATHVAVTKGATHYRAVGNRFEGGAIELADAAFGASSTLLHTGNVESGVTRTSFRAAGPRVVDTANVVV